MRAGVLAVAMTMMLSGAVQAQTDSAAKAASGKKAQPASAEALLKKSGCGECHARQTNLAAPALVTISEKYRNNPEAVSIITTTVKNGKHGREVLTMPAHSDVSDADAKRIAEYILSLRRPAAK